MKYCTKCGKELLDEAVICPGCGCAVENTQVSEPVPQAAPESKSASVAAIVLGIIGIVFSFIFALAGHVTSIIAIVIGAKDVKKKKNPAGLILGIIGEILSIVSSLIGIFTAISALATVYYATDIISMAMFL